jgi:hypothetical protein
MLSLHASLISNISMVLYQERWLLFALSLLFLVGYALARTSAVSEDSVGDYEHLQAIIDDGSLVTIRISYEEGVVTSDTDVLYSLCPGTRLLLTRTSYDGITKIAVWIVTDSFTKGLFVGHLLGPCDQLTMDEQSVQLVVIRISLTADIVNGHKLLLAHTEPSMAGTVRTDRNGA